MMKPRIRVIIGSVMLLSAASCRHAIADPPAITSLMIDSAAAKEDRRLGKPVTLSTPAMPLKAVLSQFAKQTGIPISIDERDPSSGYRVQIECKDTPVWKMLDAIYSVFSITRGEWSWTRIGKPG